LTLEELVETNSTAGECLKKILNQNVIFLLLLFAYISVKLKRMRFSFIWNNSGLFSSYEQINSESLLQIFKVLLLDYRSQVALGNILFKN